MFAAYTEDLYRAGAYTKYKTVADEMIACCLERQPSGEAGWDLFLATIFRKADSCYQLEEYGPAAHLFKEVLRMDPFHSAGKAGLRRTLYRAKPENVLNARAVSVLLIMSAALLTAFELLAIRNFFPVLGEGSRVDEDRALRIGGNSAGRQRFVPTAQSLARNKAIFQGNGPKEKGQTGDLRGLDGIINPL
ncbi:MAG: hypothetical protein IPG32_18520 [Saprospirales bacterium]|nr:hypothetical protein [Saprospirales bacterium]